MQQFDATKKLHELREQQRIIKRKYYHKSRLNRYRAELVSLRVAGASYAECVMWLKKEKRLVVSKTTVMRFLRKLPEIQENKNNAELS